MAERNRAGKRVLIVSASAGAGHVRAAEALAADFRAWGEKTAGGVEEVAHWDMLKYTTMAFRYAYSRLYLDMVNHAPSVFGFMFKQTNVPWKNERLRLLMEKFNARKLVNAVRTYRPDVVVATHFTPGNVLANLYEKKVVGVKPAIVVTDFDAHALWLTRSYGKYFVMLPETKVFLERVGIEGEKVVVSGIPIDPVFRVEKEQRGARRKLGLREDLTTVLVSAGGFGVGPVEGIIEELLRMETPAQVVAIAGKGEALRRKLERVAGRGNAGKVRLVPVGFTREMDEYMAAADVMISKPGGMTTCEAMARGLPMVVANPIPGQEEGNADHLLEAGAAVRANTVATLGWKVEQLLRDPERLGRMRRAAKAFGKADAGRVIVEEVMGGGGAGGERNSVIV